MEDAGKLRQKAERWRMLALSLNDRDDQAIIEAFAAELERQADALSGSASRIPNRRPQATAKPLRNHPLPMAAASRLNRLENR
jgi:hypothetical protein